MKNCFKDWSQSKKKSTHTYYKAMKTLEDNSSFTLAWVNNETDMMPAGTQP